ncbi:MAG: phosphoglycerate dehydrogenase, partial [Frankia sp.]|nr:phosphoglycerate dehydrogenase [Frankia sp.]
MSTVVVAEPLSPAGIEMLSASFDVVQCDGADRGELLRAVASADALVIRSATQVDAEVIAAAPGLKVVARAGIGLDNVDVDAATKAGVMVVNAPQSNVVSAAEHAVALLLAQARNIPAADRSLKSGKWQRSRFEGVEVAGKTVGIVGLGRVGVLVAQRLSAFGARLVAYDPYVPAGRAAQIGVRLLPLDDLLRESDFVTIHLPKTPETVGLIGERELSLAKPGVRIVNTARGGLVDEDALAVALKDGRVAGAAIDVFATEPTTSSPLFEFDNVIVTPHLGASTVEAQEKAGLTIAEQVRLALSGEFVPNAVNVQAGGIVAEELRPALPLAERLGRLFTGLAGGVAATLTVEARGEIAVHDTRVLTLAALKGVFSDVVEESVSYVNAPLLAEERGVVLNEVRSTDSPDYRNVLTVRGTLANGEEVRVSGTLTGPRQVEKLTEVDGFDLELAPAPHLAFFRYHDRPGIVGAVGKILGDADVNIANMQVARREAGGEALMAITVDSEIPPG